MRASFGVKQKEAIKTLQPGGYSDHDTTPIRDAGSTGRPEDLSIIAAASQAAFHQNVPRAQQLVKNASWRRCVATKCCRTTGQTIEETARKLDELLPGHPLGAHGQLREQAHRTGYV